MKADGDTEDDDSPGDAAHLVKACYFLIFFTQEALTWGEDRISKTPRAYEQR
jgi:hypothetical protein